MSVPLFLIIPTRDNPAVYIDRLCTSLISQTYSRWRVLFVDASTNISSLTSLSQYIDIDSRFALIKQGDDYSGIYGAMNMGLKYASDEDFVIFWGCDDWASSRSSLASIASSINSSELKSDLYVFSGQYYSPSLQPGRLSSFAKACTLSVMWYKLYLMLGCIPPHQASVFSPLARNKISSFSPKFYLAADLAYFLALSKHRSAVISIFEDNVVSMMDSGVSSKYFWRRLNEVWVLYRHAFSFLCVIPFLLRYIQRFMATLRAYIHILVSFCHKLF